MADEARLQSACVRWAKAQGCVGIKQDGALAGMADYVFLLPGGRVWLVEFKSPAGRLSPRQIYLHEKMAAMGHPVSVIRHRAIFCELLAAHLKVVK